MVFDKECRVVELPTRTDTSTGDENEAEKPSSYRIPKKLREAGITPSDVDSVEQLIEHNLVVSAVISENV